MVQLLYVTVASAFRRPGTRPAPSTATPASSEATAIQMIPSESIPVNGNVPTVTGSMVVNLTGKKRPAPTPVDESIVEPSGA